MDNSRWIKMSEMPSVQAMFPDSSWVISDIAEKEFQYLRRRLDPVTGYGSEYDLAATYFQYNIGDSLEPHTDEYTSDDAGIYNKNGKRQIAVIGYLHDRWEAGWGGELSINGELYPPAPGTLIWFDVPCVHEVLKVTPKAENLRLSVSGWYIERQSPSLGGTESEGR